MLYYSKKKSSYVGKTFVWYTDFLSPNYQIISNDTTFFFLLRFFFFLYHRQDFYWTWRYIYIWVTRRLSYKKQELLTFQEHSQVLVGSVLCCVFYLSSSCPVCPMLSVSLDCPFLIALSVFSNVYHLFKRLSCFHSSKTQNKQTNKHNKEKQSKTKTKNKNKQKNQKQTKMDFSIVYCIQNIVYSKYYIVIMYLHNNYHSIQLKSNLCVPVPDPK